MEQLLCSQAFHVPTCYISCPLDTLLVSDAHLREADVGRRLLFHFG